MATKKKRILTDTFEIKGENEEIYLVDEYTEFIETFPNEWTEGLKILQTKEGYHVNVLDNNCFNISELNLKCKKMNHSNT